MVIDRQSYYVTSAVHLLALEAFHEAFRVWAVEVARHIQLAVSVLCNTHLLHVPQDAKYMLASESQ